MANALEKQTLQVKNYHDSYKSKSCLPNLSFLKSINEEKNDSLWLDFKKKLP